MIIVIKRKICKYA